LDVKKRFSEEQIIGFLKEAERGIPVKELCRTHGEAPHGEPHDTVVEVAGAVGTAPHHARAHLEQHVFGEPAARARVEGDETAYFAHQARILEERTVIVSCRSVPGRSDACARRKIPDGAAIAPSAHW
jgi:hypothetical protein